MTPPASEGFDRRRLAGLAAAIGAISAVGTSLSLGMPLLAVILEQRGHSGSVIGLVTVAAGMAAMGILSGSNMAAAWLPAMPT